MASDPGPGWSDDAIGPGEARMIAMNERLIEQRDALRAEVSALRAALEAIADSRFWCTGKTPTGEHTCRAFPPTEVVWCQRCIARDALTRYPREDR